MSKTPTQKGAAVEMPGAESLARLKEIITETCVMTADKHWIVSPRGKDNTWQIDMRQAFLNAEALDIVSDLFWDHFADLMPLQLGGLEIAAIPLVVALTLKARSRGLSVNGFIVRKERKRHGIGKVIEGQVTNDPIVIVDDLMNSGSSMERVRVALDEFGHKIDAIFVVLNFRSETGRDWLTRQQLGISSLFTIDDFGLSLSSSSSKTFARFTNIWKFKSPQPNHYEVVPKSAPVVAGDKVLLGSDRGTLWALNSASGEVVWQFQIAHPGRKGIWSRPTIHEERVFFGAYDGNLYCVSLSDGNEVWRQCDADWIGSSPILSPDDGLLWIGLEYEHNSNRGSVAAFKMADGEKVWEFPVAGYVHGTPAHSRKHTAVAIGSNDRNVYLLDAFTGELRWKFATNGMVKEKPTFDESRDLLYVTGFDGYIRALDVASGRQVWAISTSNIIYSAPLVVGTKLLVTSTDKRLHVIDFEMQTHKTLDLGSKSVSTPVVIKRNVFFGTNGGLIWEFDPSLDVFVGKHQLPDAVTSRLAWCPQNNLMFALTHMNQLFAFRRDTPSSEQSGGL